MALNSYLSIVTLNVNGLNAPNQKTQGSKMGKKNQYAVYKKLILDPKTPPDLK